MAKDILGWTKWSPHLGNAITIVLGVPAMIGIAAGWWAYLAPSSGLVVAMIDLAAFMMTLWSCIGFLWLKDRNRVRYGVATLDCSWGLRFDGAFLNHNPNNDLEWQVRIVVRNSMPFPIRGDIIEQRIIIEGRVPDVKMEAKPFPFVLGPGEATQIAYPPYKKGTLPDLEMFKGEIDFSGRYGHPDGPYTRVAIRRFAFHAIVKPPALPGLFPVLPSFGGPIPLPIGQREQDRDDPYAEEKQRS